MGERRLLALVRGHRMKSLLRRMLDPDEFLSDHGIRSLSRDPPRAPVRAGARRPGARRSTTSRPSRGPGAVRRQLQLARAGLVPDQLPADRGAPEVRPLLRRRLPVSSCPTGSAPAGLARRGRRRPRPPARDRSSCATTRGRRPFRGPDAPSSRNAPCDDHCCCSTSTSTATRAAGLGASHQTGWTGARREAPRPARAAAARVSGAGAVAAAGGGVTGSVALRPSAAARGPAEPAPAPSNRTDRIAIVHDYFTQRGGAERLVGDLARLLPVGVDPHLRVRPRTGCPEALGLGTHPGDPPAAAPSGPASPLSALAPLLPTAFGRMHLDAPQVVVSSTSAFAHHVRPPDDAVHVAYWHSPPHFLWDAGRVLPRPLGPRRRPGARCSPRCDAPTEMRSGGSTPTWRTRLHGRSDPRRPTTGGRRSSTRPSTPPSSRRGRNGRADSWSSSRLRRHKRLDLAVEAATRHGWALDIIGEGPDEAALRRAAGPIDPVPRPACPTTRWRAAMARCVALIVPGSEDFGMTMAEVQAAGRPPVAFARGGALEIIRRRRDRIHFRSSQTVDALTAAMAPVDRRSTSTADALVASARRFDRARVRPGPSLDVMRAGRPVATGRDDRPAARRRRRPRGSSFRGAGLVRRRLVRARWPPGSPAGRPPGASSPVYTDFLLAVDVRRDARDPACGFWSVAPPTPAAVRPRASLRRRPGRRAAGRSRGSACRCRSTRAGRLQAPSSRDRRIGLYVVNEVGPARPDRRTVL